MEYFSRRKQVLNWVINGQFICMAGRFDRPNCQQSIYYLSTRRFSPSLPSHSFQPVCSFPLYYFPTQLMLQMSSLVCSQNELKHQCQRLESSTSEDFTLRMYHSQMNKYREAWILFFSTRHCTPANSPVTPSLLQICSMLAKILQSLIPLLCILVFRVSSGVVSPDTKAVITNPGTILAVKLLSVNSEVLEMLALYQPQKVRLRQYSNKDQNIAEKVMSLRMVTLKPWKLILCDLISLLMRMRRDSTGTLRAVTTVLPATEASRVERVGLSYFWLMQYWRSCSQNCMQMILLKSTCGRAILRLWRDPWRLKREQLQLRSWRQSGCQDVYFGEDSIGRRVEKTACSASPLPKGWRPLCQRSRPRRTQITPIIVFVNITAYSQLYRFNSAYYRSVIRNQLEFLRPFRQESSSAE